MGDVEGCGDSILLLPASNSASSGAEPRARSSYRLSQIKICGERKPVVSKLSSKDEWRTASEAEVVAFVRALHDPVRRAILKLLELWPMRQYELTQILSEVTGRYYRDSLVHYHLRELERAGLIGFGTTRNENRAKIIYRKVDYRVQFKPRPEPEHLERYARKRIIGELKKALRKERKRWRGVSRSGTARKLSGLLGSLEASGRRKSRKPHTSTAALPTYSPAMPRSISPYASGAGTTGG